MPRGQLVAETMRKTDIISLIGLNLFQGYEISGMQIWFISLRFICPDRGWRPSPGNQPLSLRDKKHPVHDNTKITSVVVVLAFFLEFSFEHFKFLSDV